MSAQRGSRLLAKGTASLLLFASLFVLTKATAQPKAKIDLRNIRTGATIYRHGYCDQPYVVVTDEGSWLTVFTTGATREGEEGQYIVSTLSRDRGLTWSEPVTIEPAEGPEASWAMPLMTPSGRVYVFYAYNGDRIRTLPSGHRIRADMLGWYCYKYSDDNGGTWSKRYRLPVRLTDVDRFNDWKGRVQIMWGIGKPITHKDSAYFAFTKIGKFMLEQSEGWFFRSDNILSEPNPDKIVWQMLPEGQHGLRAAKLGPIQSEQNLVALNNGDLYCMYRTVTGYPAHAYSRDGGRTWSRPEIATYTPGGQKIKHPRACARLWKTSNNKYLLWFHNHGGRWFQDRNPAWISGGMEKNGYIHWSQPEILLYDPDLETRVSYPDLIEQDGGYWVTQTQKSVARIHEIDPTLLLGLWNQGKVDQVTKEGLVLSLQGTGLRAEQIRMPQLPQLIQSGGFSVDFWMKLEELSSGQVILDSRDKSGKGLLISTAKDGTVQIDLNDGTTTASGKSSPDYGANGLLNLNQWHHIVIIVDGGPKIISFVIDGRLDDGGEYRQYGWARFSPHLGDVSGSGEIRIAPSLRGQLGVLRFYDRYLRTSEAIGNFHAGLR